MCFGICNQKVLFSEDDVRPDHTCFVLCRPCCLDAVVIIRPSLGRKFWHAQLAAMNAFKLQLCCLLLVGDALNDFEFDDDNIDVDIDEYLNNLIEFVVGVWYD